MATSSYKELTAQIEKLTKQAEQAREKELESVITQIRQLMGEFGITAADLGLKAPGRGRRKAGPASAPKFRDPETGATWSGRGRAPAWISGKDRSKYAV
jgi:DNA-binding protein H-NS